MTASTTTPAARHVPSWRSEYNVYETQEGCDVRAYQAQFCLLLLTPDKTVHLLRQDGVLAPTVQAPLDHALEDPDQVRAAVTDTCAQRLDLSPQQLTDLRFVTVLEEHGYGRQADAPPVCTWLFYAIVEDNDNLRQRLSLNNGFHAMVAADQAQAPFVHACSSVLSRILRTFSPLLAEMERLEKRVIPSPSTPFWDLQDYHVLQPCYYIFDNPGKGIRSKSIQALADVFEIDDCDLQQLKQCVDRFHELSLIADDIEDDSTLRRDRECAHIRFGIPAAMNSTYLLFFKLIQSVPERFQAHHHETLTALVDGSVRAHRGQGLEIYWRDNKYCPTLDEYIEMVQGKTSTPFVMSAELFFLHATDYRLRAFNFFEPILKAITHNMSWLHFLFGGKWTESLGWVWKSPQQQILELFDITGIFFQIRDDYINLVDPAYWAKKGFCDDIHERKFSFPIIYMVQNRLGRYRELLDLYAREDELKNTEIRHALLMIRETAALEYTYQYLLDMQHDLYARARRLSLGAFEKLLDRLSIMPPDPVDLDGY